MTPASSGKSRVLPIIVFSQFACTSLWFASNAIMPGLIRDFQLDTSALVHLTSAVQFGFISGTLFFAIFTLADRFPPSRVFVISALFGALFNVLPSVGSHSFLSLFLLRFFTGFSLAGIYPVGMKIAADYHEKGLGKALGFLVGALVLGTAFPHLIRILTDTLPWKAVLITTSAFSILGGGLMYRFVPNGPYQKPSSKFDPNALFRVFKNPDFRAAAFGYFGHMWELYAFWTFVPVMLTYYFVGHSYTPFTISLVSFVVIGVGGISCIAGGYISVKLGSSKTALGALLLSGACCLISPIALEAPLVLFLPFLIFWGIVVIADSPQFSSLVARCAPAEIKGTALTIVNSIGFAITIVSIQLLHFLSTFIDLKYLFLFLFIGPAFGLITSGRLLKAYE